MTEGRELPGPATAFLRDVLAEAGALGLPWWQQLALTLALALLAVLGRDAWELIRHVQWKVTVEPQPVVDEGGVQPAGVVPTTGPRPSDPREESDG